MIENSSLLNVKGLSFAYEDKEVLKNVSFKLLANERLGVIGSSGSGKSTLLKLIQARILPRKGSLHLNGVPFHESRNNLLKLHPGVSLMSQDFDLDPSISADENIARAGRHLSESLQSRLKGKMLRAFQMQAFKHQKTRFLSGGQKQRVALACALIGKCELLLLDEPFSQLDYQLKQQVLEFLEEVDLAKALIIVGHEPSDLMRFCDRIAVLDKGRLLQIAEVEEIYHRPKNRRVGELSGIINALSKEEKESLGLEHQLFRPLHCRLSPDGPWKLLSISYHAFGQIGVLEHNSGVKVRAQIPMEGSYIIGSWWTLSQKKP